MMDALSMAMFSATRTSFLSSGGFCTLNAQYAMFRPGRLVTFSAASFCSSGTSDGRGAIATWHSPALSLDSRAVASGVIA